MKTSNRIYYILAILLIAFGAAPTAHATPITWTITEPPYIEESPWPIHNGEVTGWLTTDSYQYTWTLTAFEIDTHYNDPTADVSYSSAEGDTFIALTKGFKLTDVSTNSFLQVGFIYNLFDYVPETTFQYAVETNMTDLDPLNWFAARNPTEDVGLISQGNPIPEPTTVLLLSCGLIVLAGYKRRFKK